MTGTPEAPGLLMLSRRRASSSRSASRQALNNVNSIRSCCARLPPMRSFCPASGASASIARGKIPAFESRKAPCQCRKVRAGRVTPLARQFLDLPSTRVERRVIAHDRLCQDDVQIGEPVARPRQRAVRVVVQRAPGSGVPRMAGEFGAPQKRRPIRHFLLRPAAVPVERDGVPVQPQRLCPIAGLDFAEREMPAQMAIEKALARIGGEPRGQEGAGRVRLTALVTNMGEAMRAMRIVRVRRHGLLDLRPGRRELTILGQRHGVIRQEPEIIAVMRREAVHQHRDLVLLSDAAGAANQAVRVCGTGDHQRVARPSVRCAYKAAIAASVRPANTRSKNAMWLASRSGRPAATSLAAARPPVPPRRRLAASGPGLCRHGPGQSRGRRRWRGHRPRLRRGRKSARDRRPECRRPARQRTQWIRQGRSDLSALRNPHRQFPSGRRVIDTALPWTRKGCTNLSSATSHKPWRRRRPSASPARCRSGGRSSGMARRPARS